MKRLFSLFVISIVLLSSGCLSSIEKDIFDGEDINSGAKYSEFNLTDSNGDFFNSNDLAGQILIVNFFYTNCPDHCPTMTSDLKQVYQEFENHIGINVSIVSITVDPWRDNTTILEEWKQSTKSNWTHLTVSDTQQSSSEMSTLAQVWNDFDVGFKIEENTTESNTSGRHHPSSYDYNIAHSTGTVLVDHEGNQRIWWGDYDWIIDLVKEDILNLVAEAENDK